MAKYAWTWTIKEEFLEEYVRLHKDPWPEVVEAHREAGFRNYSIFQNGRQMFYVFETDDIQRARDYCAENEACKRWNDMCGGMIESDFSDGRIESGLSYLEEIFFIA
jgi:L-rhamnose mutarotase